MKVFRINLGHGNLFWEEALARGEILLYEDQEVFEEYQRGGDANAVTAAMKRCHRRYQWDETNDGAFTYWRNLRPRFVESDGDLWLHIHGDRIWWAISRDEISVGERREIDSDTGVKRPIIPLWKATKSGWSNETRDGVRLTPGNVQPHAWRHIHLQGTFDKLNDNVAAYFKALIAGQDTSQLVTGDKWQQDARKHGYHQRPTFSPEWEATANRIWAQMIDSTSRSGQTEERVIKVKRNRFASRTDFFLFFEKLRLKQANKCVYTGLTMVRDDQDPEELRASLDRIDSDGDYAEANVQLVCRFINKMKSDTAHEDFARQITLIRRSS